MHMIAGLFGGTADCRLFLLTRMQVDTQKAKGWERWENKRWCSCRTVTKPSCVYV